MKDKVGAFIILILVIVVIFLAFQLQELNNQTKDLRRSDQDLLTHAARLLCQSKAQTEPLFSTEHSWEAKFIVDKIIKDYKGVLNAEKILKLPKGELTKLRDNSDTQYRDLQTWLYMLTEEFRQIDPEMARMAGLDGSRALGQSKSPR